MWLQNPSSDACNYTEPGVALQDYPAVWGVRSAESSNELPFLMEIRMALPRWSTWSVF